MENDLKDIKEMLISMNQELGSMRQELGNVNQKLERLENRTSRMEKDVLLLRHSTSNMGDDLETVIELLKAKDIMPV